MSSKFTLITGASGGLGKAMAYEFASHGSDLILVARSEDKLERIAEDIKRKYSVEVQILPADLMKSDQTESLVQICLENHWQVETLISNAGMGSQGHFDEVNLEKQLDIVRLNILAVLELCWTFLKFRKELGLENIVNIASSTAFAPLANEAVYAASKAFILSFSEALHEEVRPEGIHVLTICPGMTKTDFFENAGFEHTSMKMRSPQEFASFTYRALDKKKSFAIHGWDNRMISLAARLLPRSAVRKIFAKFG